MASGIFSPETEEEFLSFERDYTGVAQVQSQHASEPDSDDSDESSESGHSEDLADYGSDPEAEKEQECVDKFVRESCGCEFGSKLTPCSSLFSKELIIDQREKCLELEKSELDMAVIGQLQAFNRHANSDKSARHKYVEFLFNGKRICRTTFLFLHTLSLKRYRNLLVHYNQVGLVPREHGNRHKTPHNRVAYDHIEAIRTFITNFAEVHALPLPGRMPNCKSKALLLPSHLSKSEVYRQYKQSCLTSQRQPVSWGKFHEIWSSILPHIDTMKPSSDLCFECQENATLILQGANLLENEKSDRYRAAEKHIQSARNQRQHYNDQCKRAKDHWEMFKGTASSYSDIMHYSFDYAQNLQFPCNPQQPGPIYFKSTRKCGIFGVSCEPLSLQVNYLIDEDDDPGKGSNATISMIHHFLENHAIGKLKILLHADNCVGQNKNNNLMHYLLWRVMTGRSESAEISFMIAGHTKFAPDRFFGLIKKLYKHTFVSTLDEIQDVVKKSMLTGRNIPQLTKAVDGNRLVMWYDWKSFLDVKFKLIPNITGYHHFRFDKQSPGAVFVRKLMDSPEVKIHLSLVSTIDQGLPNQFVPKGMDVNRKWYLFDEIAKFCSSSRTASITCPRPTLPKPSAVAQDKTAPTVGAKRKRTCSHCHSEGHTKTKKGKISCPELLK